MCIGHGIRVAARAFVTFVKERLKCLLLLFELPSVRLSKEGKTTDEILCAKFTCITCD